ncbi:class I SAM-dependent methyltransferase [Massilia sp. LMS1-1-1.1]
MQPVALNPQAGMFSALAERYSSYRPRYPTSLFDFLAACVERHEQAWDCGTGNGQAAMGLVEHFRHVVATDVDAQQIAHAFQHPRIDYSIAAAETSGLATASMDLITVGEALHWFHLERFCDEARRVLRPNGMLAIWNYGRCRITPSIDRILDEFADRDLGSYWSAAALNDNVSNFPIPFSEVTVPQFEIVQHWDLNAFCGYVSSWSASATYQREQGYSPVDHLREKLEAAWMAHGAQMSIRWPLCVRVGRFMSGSEILDSV